MKTFEEWKILSTVRENGQYTDVVAATSDDGVGVMARWILVEGKWNVEVWDTEMPSESILDTEVQIPFEPPTNKEAYEAGQRSCLPELSEEEWEKVSKMIKNINHD